MRNLRNSKSGSSARSTQIHSALDCLRKLIVISMESSIVRPIHGHVWCDSLALDAISIPTHLCANGNDDSAIVPDLEG